MQRFCLHDGPGIRTVVFLKGCPLRCLWCQNPESLKPKPEMAHFRDRCSDCLACAKACPHGAIREGHARVDRELCQACGRCSEVCPNNALRLVGRRETPAQLLQTVALDQAYYERSAGGLTLSGGEPLLQAEAASELLAGSKSMGLSTAVETCGAVPWSAIEKVLPLVDLFYFDLKVIDETRHRELTGQSPQRILDNARLLLERGANVCFRMPVIPGYTDVVENVTDVGAFLNDYGHKDIRLLPYHAGGQVKIDRVGSGQPKFDCGTRAAAAALTRTRSLLQSLGFDVEVEGESNGQAVASRASGFTSRVQALRQAVLESAPAICTERARLVTEYFKDKGRLSKPVVIQKAEALGHILRLRSAAIYEHELLVGCFSSKRVGGSVFPELHGVTLLEDLFSISRRRTNPLQLQPAERAELLRLLPFWLNKFLVRRAFPLGKTLRFVADQLKGTRYLINESGGISHFVPDYETLLELGTAGLAARAREAREGTDDPARRDFYRAVEIACRGLEDLASGYARRARELAAEEGDAPRRRELEQIASVCERVPRMPATSLHEALQSILFAQIALNLESLDNAVSPGRLDQLLLPFYRADLRAGQIDLDGARELIGCFTVKMSEIVPVFSSRVTRYHGGLFNGQVVTVGGCDRDGQDATNELTWLFLDAMDELRMRQPNFHARLHSASPDAYVERIVDMLRRGSGAPSLMNDEVVVPMLERRGSETDDARDYSPVGCVEPVSCAATYGSTDAALLNLALCLERALGLKSGGAELGPPVHDQGIEGLIERFESQLQHLVAELVEDLHAIERANAIHHPTPLTSALVRGCLESGLDASAGGAVYNGSGVQGVGVADLADSFAAIEEVVFKRQACDLTALIEALRRNFKGRETLRAQLLSAPKYGNDLATADRYAARVVQLFSDALAKHGNTRGGFYWAGFYSVTAHIAFGETTGALPSGRLAGQALANGLSPVNGQERFGPTAALNSAASVDPGTHARNGVNVNLRIDSQALQGDVGLRSMTGLIKGYFAKGGMQVQVNALDPAILAEAAAEAGRHPWLLVRVSGYSAYFDDLSPSVQQDLIERFCHGGADNP